MAVRYRVNIPNGISQLLGTVLPTVGLTFFLFLVMLLLVMPVAPLANRSGSADLPSANMMQSTLASTAGHCRSALLSSGAFLTP